MPFGAPKWPSELQLGPPSRTPSSTWRFLGRFLVLLQPSESSSRLDESSILMVQAFLQSKRSWTAISHLFGFNLDLLDASWAQLGASWASLGLNLEPLGCLLGSAWSISGFSRAQFGLCTPVCAAHPGLLDASWPPSCLVLSALAALSEPIWIPKWPSELQLGLRTANMTSILVSVALPRGLRTFKKCGRVIKNHGFCLLGS